MSAVPERLRAAQLDLFRPAGPQPAQLAATLARLGALCGDGAVGAPQLVDSHRPDAYAVAPFTAAETAPAATPAPAMLPLAKDTPSPFAPENDEEQKNKAGKDKGQDESKPADANSPVVK